MSLKYSFDFSSDKCYIPEVLSIIFVSAGA